MKRREFLPLFLGVLGSLYYNSFASEFNGDETEEKPFVYLTIDDGPTRNMKKILDVLEKYSGNYATFFVVGKNLSNEENLRIVKEAIEKGHTVGNHSYSHPHFSDLKSSRIIGKGGEIERCEELLENIYGHMGVENPKLFRYPYFDLGDRETVDEKKSYGSNEKKKKIREFLLKRGYKTFGCNVDILDWDYYSGKRSLDEVLDSIKSSKQGDIILTHDFLRKGKISTPEEAIKVLIEKGFVLRALKPKKLVSIIEGPV